MPYQVPGRSTERRALASPVSSAFGHFPPHHRPARPAIAPPSPRPRHPSFHPLLPLPALLFPCFARPPRHPRVRAGVLPPAAAMVAEGDAAPDFTATDCDGEPFTLSAVTPGRPVVLYFYPKSYVLVAVRWPEGGGRGRGHAMRQRVGRRWAAAMTSSRGGSPPADGGAACWGGGGLLHRSVDRLTRTPVRTVLARRALSRVTPAAPPRTPVWTVRRTFRHPHAHPSPSPPAPHLPSRLPLARLRLASRPAARPRRAPSATPPPRSARSTPKWSASRATPRRARSKPPTGCRSASLVTPAAACAPSTPSPRRCGCCRAALRTSLTRGGGWCGSSRRRSTWRRTWRARGRRSRPLGGAAHRRRREGGGGDAGAAASLVTAAASLAAGPREERLPFLAPRRDAPVCIGTAPAHLPCARGCYAPGLST